jgi:WhiB family redox-sensing transcriptional regulator
MTKAVLDLDPEAEASTPSDPRRDTQWRERALCGQTEPEAFFPEKGGNPAEAKQVCGRCDVRDQCLAYALGANERFGIWGGLTTGERDRLVRGKQPGRRSAAQARRDKRNALIVAMADQRQDTRVISDEAEVTDRTVLRVLARHRDQQEADLHGPG